jgi:GT2 family glycosyltransferase
MDEPDVRMMDGCTFDAPGSAGFFDRPPIGEPPAVTEVEIVYGCCLTTSAEVFRRVGLLDERFFLIHEESDFCLRARRAGFRCGVLSEVLVWHKGSSSFQREGKPLQRYFDARNLFLLLWKHGGSYRRPPRRLHLWRKYLKHVYYFYCLCRDRSNDAGANAVVDGLHDALFGYHGPLKQRPRALAPLIRWAFERWRMRKGTPA